MLGRVATAVVALALLLGAAGWFASAPQVLVAADLPAHEPDIANGELIFHAGGCSSCHAAPGAKGADKLLLAGGLELATDFGRFRVPNISPDAKTGIGGWSTGAFVNAVMRGVSPGGAHYYPAFPYTSYARMRIEDAIDLKGFMDTLPAVENQVGGHDLAFPYNIRRGVGLWKRLYLSRAPVVTLNGASEAVARGQYLVEGPGHCGECHTKRDRLGGLVLAQWLAGAPNPEGRGIIPNITPHQDGLTWSQDEIVETFASGFTPDFDTLGGRMADVQQNLAQLPESDLQAIAGYLKAVPPLPDAVERTSKEP